jgi:xanthine/uracil permease
MVAGANTLSAGTGISLTSINNNHMLGQYSALYVAYPEETKWVLAIVVILIAAVFLSYNPKRFKR